MKTTCKGFINYIKKYDNDEKGFSLVEMIVVIAIIIILVAMLVPNVVGYIEKTNHAADKATAKVIGEACEMVLNTDEEARESFYKHNTTSYQVKNDAGETYTLTVVCYGDYFEGSTFRNGTSYKKRGKCIMRMKHGNNESIAFVNALNKMIGEDVDIQNHTHKPVNSHDATNALNGWCIGYPSNGNAYSSIWGRQNKAPKGYFEVWLCEGNDKGHAKSKPVYRLYPTAAAKF